MQGMLLTVVIVTYRSKHIVGCALEALHPGVLEGWMRCIMVDNDSQDGTLEYVSAAFPWVHPIDAGDNLGYGRACNLGFQQVSTPYVLFLNPDAIIKCDALAALIRFMVQNPKAAATAPATRVGEGELQEAGLMLTPMSLVYSALGWGNPYPRSRVIEPGEASFQTNWLCGGIVMFSSEWFRRVGGFDPRFFLYFDETDLFLRTLALGGEIWAVGEAVAYHEGGASARATGVDLESGCIAEHFYRSRYYFLAKHYGLMRATVAEVVSRMIQSVKRGLKLIFGAAPLERSSVRRPFLRMPAPIRTGPGLGADP